MSLADYATTTAPGIPKIRVVPGATQYAWAEDYNRLADGISLLADELNQLCMSVEVFASTPEMGEGDKILFNAARRLRGVLVELIPS